MYERGLGPLGSVLGRAIVATAETYGADKLWVVLKPIPIDWA